MVKCLALHLAHHMESHLGLIKELIWIHHMASLMVLMKANHRVPCSEIELKKKMVMHLVLLMVLYMDILMA